MIAARASALIYGLLGAGFGVGTAVTLALFARNGELPMTPWGFRSLAGPVTPLGPPVTMALGTALIGVCALDVLTASGLWRGRRWAGRLGLATTPLAFGLGLAFALPFLLVGVPLRVGLVLASWRRLT